MNYEITGDGDTAIFLHGWGHSLNSFKIIADSLKRKLKSYLIDLPGFGFSSLPPQNWGSPEYSEFITGFIREMNLNDIVLTGHSFGGKVSIQVVNKIPEKIKKLILMSSPGLKSNMTYDKFIKIYLFKTAKFIKNKNLLLKAGQKLYDKIERFSGSDDYLNAGDMKEILKNVVRENITEEIEKVKCPTLIMWGESDEFTPVKNAYIFNELIQNSKLITLPNLTHNLHLEAPHQIAHHIKEFLTD